MGWTCSTRVGCEKHLQNFVQNPESTRQFGKYNSQLAENTKMGLKYIV
jgi:hypothetical protein